MKWSFDGLNTTNRRLMSLVSVELPTGEVLFRSPTDILAELRWTITSIKQVEGYFDTNLSGVIANALVDQVCRPH